MAFLLQDKTSCIPNFLNDTTLLGSKSQYEKNNSTYKVIPKNSYICHFIWEYAIDLNQVFHHLKHTEATVSAKKLQLCKPEILVVGRVCTYKRQKLDEMTVGKILRWLEYRNVLEVRGFL
ncbi:hypothetical protein AN958_09055 [Leucoagaricus sp. SymC.cos]|nr:hypothetical protein AN958_09055 [Leucoagaricus sp. SymC.cos]